MQRIMVISSQEAGVGGVCAGSNSRHADYLRLTLNISHCPPSAGGGRETRGKEGVGGEAAEGGRGGSKERRVGAALASVVLVVTGPGSQIISSTTCHCSRFVSLEQNRRIAEPLIWAESLKRSAVPYHSESANPRLRPPRSQARTREAFRPKAAVATCATSPQFQPESRAAREVDESFKLQ
jgi:hypothetical protein